MVSGGKCESFEKSYVTTVQAPGAMNDQPPSSSLFATDGSAVVITLSLNVDPSS